MMLILGVLVLVLCVGVWLVVSRRSAISEEELDRRLTQLRRAELVTTEEERDRHAANLNAILNGEKLTAAPHQPEDWQRRTATPKLWPWHVELVKRRLSAHMARWLPRILVLSSVFTVVLVLRLHDVDVEQRMPVLFYLFW